MGRALAALGCAPAAIGLQWLKAAAHARNEAEIEQASGGLRQASERGGAHALAERLCPYVADSYVGPAQQAAAEQAGLACGAR
jgi:hypothetical protein